MPSKSELQSLLRKMGGTPESGDSVDETIKKITEVYEPGGGGSGLPEGGSAGQILKKKSSAEGDAEWADESSGGGGIFAVEFTGSDYTGSYQTPNKTFDEIYSAYQNGQTIIGIKGSSIYQLNYISESSITFRLTFESSDPSNPDIKSTSIRRITWTKSDAQAVLMIFNNYSRKVLTIRLVCNDDYSYKDSPSGAFSVDIEPYQLGDIIDAYCGRSNYYSDVVLAYGPEYDDWSQPAQSERYALVFADWSETYNDVGDPIRNVSLTFKVLSTRGNTVVMKTVVVSGDVYSEAYGRDTPIAVTYSEIPLGGSN